ncbi:unnamed protein product [Adineta steineri]|uniref:Uncharacterized protein n=1 Tax=Adineta steineri TaxID=433720 RepID=A0A820B6I7_9BILA|nr:unnamed protein product [Adineta steineri]
MSWSSFKTFLTEDGSNKNGSLVVTIIVLSYFFALFPLLIFGINEIRQAKTCVKRRCRVISMGVDGPLQNRFWRPVWKITTLDEENVGITGMDQTVVSQVLYSSKSWAQRVAKKKKINQMYSCYRHRDYPADGSWGYQWHKPTKLNAYIMLVTVLVLCVLGSTLFLLRQYYLPREQNLLPHNYTLL